MDREERKKQRKRRDILRLLLALLVCAGLALAISACKDLHSGRVEEPCVIEVPEGAGSFRLAAILKDSGAIRYPALFKLYARLQKAPLYQQGGHTLYPGDGYGEIINRLTSPPDAADPNIRRVTIPEGYELRQIIDLLVENGLGDREVFRQEIENGEFPFSFIGQIPARENRLEGYLYPDTYLFSIEETEHEILERMLTPFAERVLPVYEVANTPYTLDQVVTLASVIEREAADDEERPLVSSVFHNRLLQGVRLESCATVQYILKERKTVLSLQDTAIDSPYNTYKNAGLPLGPIASPGLSSIEAALYPADTDYLYFLAEADGSSNRFSKTFDEHTKKMQEIQR